MDNEKENLIQQLTQSKEYIELDLADHRTDSLISENSGNIPYTFSNELFDLSKNIFSVMKNIYDMEVVFHKHDFYEIQYVYSGCVKQEINGIPVNLEKGTLTVFNKNVAHAIHKGTSEDRMFHVGIHESIFDPSFFHRIVETSSIAKYLFQSIYVDKNNTDFLLVKCDDDFMRPLIEAMQREYLSRNIGFAKNIEAYLTLLINKAPSIDDEQSQMSDHVAYIQMRMVEINTCLNEQYRDMTLEKLAADLHVHPNYLSRFIHMHFGKKYNELLTDIRMQKAAYLLVATNLNIESISREIGYKNQNYFYKAFHNQKGVTPSQYRIQCRSDQQIQADR